MHARSLVASILLALPLAACGGGGAGGGPGLASEGAVGPAPLTPMGAELTDEGRFGVRLAGAEPLVALVLTDAEGAEIRFAGLHIEPGELWEEPAPGLVTPGTYLLRAHGVSGFTYARMCAFLPGVAEAPVISNAHLEIESLDPDFTFDPDFPRGPGGRQVP